MKSFYRVVNGKAQTGAGEAVLPGFTEYVVGEEPPELVDALSQESFEKTKKEALSKAEEAFNKQCDVITQNAPSKEIDSWKKQEDEARAWSADNTAPTPLIDGLLISRGLGETKAELVQKVIDNADLWATAYSEVLGIYQNRVKRINAVGVTLADIQAVIDEMDQPA